MSEQEILDRRFMAHALQLAERGLYTTDPNPRVGCVLARGERMIGRGWHQIAGEAHAEVAAIGSTSEDLSGATAYISLEPCCFAGRTGACTEALIEAGIARAVVAMVDPHPSVSGNGISALRGAGIEVVTPLLEAEAQALNPGFVKRHLTGLPFVRCKLAMSLDGRTALTNGLSRWITGAASREDVQRLRARSSAIVTGIGTVLADDPSLTIRVGELKVAEAALALKRQPLRVVVDSKLRIPPEAAVLRHPGETLVATARGEIDRIDRLRARGTQVEVYASGNETVELRPLLEGLARRECNEVLVEAGPTLAGAFLQGGLVDELVIYVAPRLMGDRARPLLHLPEIVSMEETQSLVIKDLRHLGDDIRITAAIAERNG